MKIHTIIALLATVLATPSSFAADPSSASPPLTRAQVKKSVLDARVAGELRAGDDPTYPASRPRNAGRPLKHRKKTSSGAPSSHVVARETP